MYYGESKTDILNRLVGRFNATMSAEDKGGEIKRGSALWVLIDSLAEEISQLSYHIASNNTHTHTVAGHETSLAQDPTPPKPEVEADAHKEKPELPLAASDFMPELKKV